MKSEATLEICNEISKISIFAAANRQQICRNR